MTFTSYRLYVDVMTGDVTESHVFFVRVAMPAARAAFSNFTLSHFSLPFLFSTQLSWTRHRPHWPMNLWAHGERLRR